MQIIHTIGCTLPGNDFVFFFNFPSSFCSLSESFLRVPGIFFLRFLGYCFFSFFRWIRELLLVHTRCILSNFTLVGVRTLLMGSKALFRNEYLLWSCDVMQNVGVARSVVG